MATKIRRSPWRSEVYAPPVHSSDNPEIYFGCQPWTASADLTMGRQDPETGLWSPGDQRRGETCARCGGVLGQNIYCEACTAASQRIEDKLDAEYQDDIARERARLEAEQRERQEQMGTFAQRHHGRKAGFKDSTV
jgi:hypothetical protein